MNDIYTVVDKLLESDLAKQPLLAPNTSSYRDDLELKLNNFITVVKTLSPQGGIIEKTLFEASSELENITKKILSALDEYLSGNAGEAYRHIADLLEMEIITRHIFKLCSSMDKYSGKNDSKSLYRVRLSEKPLFKKHDMFHIPFNSRHLVGTQRYSIAGVPCLYLGSSLYVCWHEMGSPDLNKLYLSRFGCRKKNVQYLNLAYSLKMMKPEGLDTFIDNTSEIERDLARIIFLPILIACSYKKAHSPANFNEEYIIPNLLLQWVSKKSPDISGISYLSTNTPQMKHHDININFVFPPKTYSSRESFYCQTLSDIFELSDPVSWQLLDTVSIENKYNNTDTLVSINNMHEDYIKYYHTTKFKDQENKLKKMVVNKVHN